ncbi:MAG: SDR family NAD(P)-dependent oxidoreductase, partial [Desulfovibrionaceae bacterium]|nr:SDR family NAD(P)-dependent oxidoreductase [Desulfovibrionaceae bacterium]
MNTEKERRSWLVTGCSSGLGRALAEAVLARGDCCAVTARRPETLASFAERCPGTALVLPLDVTSPESMDNAVRAALDRFGGLDVLVNNAGYCLRGAVEECSDAEVRRQFETNFFGTVGMIRRVLPAMRAARSGAIVNFSSIAALSTSEGSAFYGASKLAVEGMSDGLRREVGPLGIRVMVVEPGPFRTRFFEALDISAGDLADYRGTAGRRKVR